MKYTNEKIIEPFESGESLEILYFWGHTNKSNKITKSCLSQWFEARFVVNGIEYLSSEQWMMAKKALLFQDQEIYEKIISCKKPRDAKMLGRKVRNFHPDVWEENRFEIVIRGNFHKFSQNKELSEFLKSTNNQILVEASPKDIIWGIGLSQDNEDAKSPYVWNGLNLLGYALMETRDILNQIVEIKVLENPTLPPWLAYPALDPYSIGWRMGYSEEHMIKLGKYFESLTEPEKKIYELTYPALGEWKGWYEN